MKRFTRTISTAVLTALGAAGLAVGVAAPASAAVLGSVAITPGSGTDETLFTGTTTGGCPSGTLEALFILQGQGLDYANDGSGVLASASNATGQGPQSFSSSLSFVKTVTAGSVTTSGDYVVTLACIDGTGAMSSTWESTLAYTAGSGGSWTVKAPPVQDRATTTALSATPSGAVEQGTAVTLNADVTPSTGADDPVGTVEFFRGTTSLGAPVAVSATGTASLTVSNLPLGASSITAKFVAGAGFDDSTSAPTTVQVDPVAARSTTSVLTVTPTSGAAYQPISLTCAVTASSGTATGTVRFLDGTTQFATSPLTAGSATVSTSSIGPGAHSFSCDYPGQAPYSASTSAVVPASYDVVGADPDPQTVVVTIPAGALSITTPYTPQAPLDLGTAVLDPATSTYSASAPFDRVTITDNRAGNLGFEASLVAGDFVNGASSFPGKHAGFTDVTAVQVPGNALQASSVVTTSTPPVTPGIGTPTKFADLAPGVSAGSVQVTATFKVAGVPTSVAAGQYTSTVTFTAV